MIDLQTRQGRRVAVSREIDSLKHHALCPQCSKKNTCKYLSLAMFHFNAHGLEAAIYQCPDYRENP